MWADRPTIDRETAEFEVIEKAHLHQSSTATRGFIFLHVTTCAGSCGAGLGWSRASPT